MNILERVINFIISEKKEGDESRLIALYPSHDSALSIMEYRETLKEDHDFSSMKNLGLEEFHATIRWWKTKDGGTNTKKICKDLENIGFDKSIKANISKVAPLGDSLSLMLECQGMQDIFSSIDKVVRDNGGPASDYPSYLPHVALVYDESFSNGFSPKIEKLPKFKIDFDRIAFVDNDDKIFTSIEKDVLIS